MEQKRILWFVAAVGIILVIIIGAGLIFYPLTKKDPVISTDTQTNTWMNPVQHQEETPTSPFPTDAETNVQEITSVTDDTNLYSDNVTTIDLNKLAAPTDFTTVRSDTAPVPEKKETPAEKPVTATKPVTTTKPAASATKTATKTETTTAKKTTTEKPAAKTTVTEYWVQTGAFSNKEYAENAQDSIAAYKIESEIFTKEVNGKTWYRVRMGPYKTRTEADYWMTVIKSDPIFADSYITEVKTSK